MKYIWPYKKNSLYLYCQTGNVGKSLKNPTSKNRGYRFGFKILNPGGEKLIPPELIWGGLVFIHMKLLESLKSLLLEYKLLSRFTSSTGQIVDIEANLHSEVGQGYSNIQRVSYDEILESFEDIKEIVVKQSNKIYKTCDRSKKECGIIIRDNLLGFDYHLWIRKTGSEKLILIINTSIRHPKKLFNSNKNNVIVVDELGDHSIIESFTNTKINGKFIQYYLFD